MYTVLSKRELRIVEEILVEILNIAPTQITPEIRIKDLGADSLHMTEIALALEEQFHRQLADEDWDKVETIGDLYESIAKLLESSGNRSND
jgi:acyl carrier protein